jgi:hypothetical protein
MGRKELVAGDRLETMTRKVARRTSIDDAELRLPDLLDRDGHDRQARPTREGVIGDLRPAPLGGASAHGHDHQRDEQQYGERREGPQEAREAEVRWPNVAR